MLEPYSARVIFLFSRFVPFRWSLVEAGICSTLTRKIRVPALRAEAEPEEISLRQELSELTPQKTMAFVTTLERLARQEGREEGLREAIRDVVLARFGQIPEEVEAQLEQSHQAATLRQWLQLALAATDQAAFTAELLRSEPGENGG